jgi:hypothetical protein
MPGFIESSEIIMRYLRDFSIFHEHFPECRLYMSCSDDHHIPTWTLLRTCLQLRAASNTLEGVKGEGSECSFELATGSGLDCRASVSLRLNAGSVVGAVSVTIKLAIMGLTY